MDPTAHPPRSTPLRAEHEALGATFTDFGGWWMPVRYTFDLAEHRAVREAAGLFDISHMGRIRVTGPEAPELLDRTLSGRISAVSVGRAKYTLLLAGDGGVLDDLIVYRIATTEYLVVANATGRSVVTASLAERAAGLDAAVDDISDDNALIALQGPAAERILGEVAGFEAPGIPLAELKRYAWTEASFDGTEAFIARTGYTGEDGFELGVPAHHATALWRALLEAGEDHGLLPAGLAARDTLRLEAGMPLYGHELSREITPAQAGLDRVVAEEQRIPLAADAPVLVGLVSAGRRAGRAGYPVLRGTERVGEITSGALSPTLGHPIAMAYVHPSAAGEGTELSIDVRGTAIPAIVTAVPFYRRKP